MITIWNTDKFQRVSSWDNKGILVVNKFWIEDDKECTIINVYAPNIACQRWELWDMIQSVLEQYNNDCVGIIGDFNSIREDSERIGRAIREDARDIRKFN
ncbi:hypothetical protein ACS0TY_024749 [Phlomoides rotata]